MRTWVGCSFAGVVTAAWLYAAGSAWAGDGGNDTGGQSIIDNVCTAVGMTSCPQLPTLTQVVLEISGLANLPPDFVRGPQGTFVANGFAALCSVSSGTVCSQVNAINAVNPPTASPVAVSDLPTLAPLAFTTGKGQALPVPLGTSGANSFLYAVATPSSPNGGVDTLALYFDYPVQTNSKIQDGQVFAQLSLPLALFGSGTERPICGAAGCPASLATLQISGCNSGPGCVNGLVVGDFSSPGKMETRSAAALGIQLTVSFSASPNSSAAHLILEVKVPLLVTAATDPAYFGVVPSGVIPVNELSGLPTAFTSDVVPPSNIGVSPQAAPVCAGGSCPTYTFPFCASFSGSGSGPLGSGSFHSAVATFLSVGTDATTYVSSLVPAQLALPSAAGLQCPF